MERREKKWEYQVTMCLSVCEGGGTACLFSLTQYTHSLDPALELIHMSLGLCLQDGGPFKHFIGARASAFLCASVYKLWNYCWSSIFDYYVVSLDLLAKALVPLSQSESLSDISSASGVGIALILAPLILHSCCVWLLTLAGLH